MSTGLYLIAFALFFSGINRFIKLTVVNKKAFLGLYGLEVITIAYLIKLIIQG